MYVAFVSAHIFQDENGRKDIELFTNVDNDNNTTGIFDDIDHALLEQIEPEFNELKSYFFIAMVESEFIRTDYFEGVEYDVEHNVTEIKSFNDLQLLKKIIGGECNDL